MENHLVALVKMAPIYEIKYSIWMSKDLHAPEPYQETIYDIMSFNCRFCVNYIWLNQVTLVTVVLIPRYDNASIYTFHTGHIYWCLDCPMGCHQTVVN